MEFNTHYSIPSAAMFESILIVGLGMIGGSVAAGAKKRGLANCVLGLDQSAEHTSEALSLGLVDEAYTSLSDIKTAPDAVFVCTPVSTIPEIVISAAEYFGGAEILITDAGSVKEFIAESVKGKLPSSCNFIPGHPIAGTEKSGPSAAGADMFAGKRMILCPDSSKQPGAAKLTAFWQELGSTVEIMDAETHDIIFAYASHLPHLYAFSIAAALADTKPRLTAEDRSDLAAMLRIAASDTTMWSDIFIMNNHHLKTAADELIERLQNFKFSENLAHSLASPLVQLIRDKKTICGKAPIDFAGGGLSDFIRAATAQPILRRGGETQENIIPALMQAISNIIAGDKFLIAKQISLANKAYNTLAASAG